MLELISESDPKQCEKLIKSLKHKDLKTMRMVIKNVYNLKCLEKRNGKSILERKTVKSFECCNENLKKLLNDTRQYIPKNEFKKYFVTLGEIDGYKSLKRIIFANRNIKKIVTNAYKNNRL